MVEAVRQKIELLRGFIDLQSALSEEHDDILLEHSLVDAQTEFYNYIALHKHDTKRLVRFHLELGTRDNVCCIANMSE